MRKWWSILAIVTCTLFGTTGCWDRHELNERAIVLITGVDEAEDGSIIESVQFALPSELGAEKGGGTKAYHFTEAKARNLGEAGQILQAKTSRQLFYGHRRAIYIGERLARHGIENVVDIFARYPRTRMRTDLFVVKGGEARAAVAKPYPFERLPAVAALKIHKEIGGHPGDTAFRDFIIDASTEWGCPTLLSMKGLQVAGRAIMNPQLQLVGYLVRDEAADRLWVVGNIDHYTYTIFVPQGHGLVSLNMHNFKRRVATRIQGKDVYINLIASATADIRENDTPLDLFQTKNIEFIKQAFEQERTEQILHMIHRVQQEYGLDIFRFGGAIHRQHPYRWKTMEHKWSIDGFKQAHVSVTVHIKVTRTGLSGAPLQMKNEDEEVS